ncbi:MAG: YkgJ family cysteine cluster protein [Myxococcales bacterium FL481]|nr:MAG: YkgJ family cysteine cluster protein [Myxococcales bacterium FL481]
MASPDRRGRLPAGRGVAPVGRSATGGARRSTRRLLVASPPVAAPPCGVPQRFAYYRQLLAKVDTHATHVTARYDASLYCQVGCTACCRQDLTVTRVEADHIAGWLAERATTLAVASDERGAADNHRQFLALAGPRACAFLGPSGRCQIYEVRPVVCRSHGLPLLAQDGLRDCCPLNFTGTVTVEDLDASALLNLDTLNTMLGAIDHAYTQQTHRPTERVSLRDLRRQHDAS